MPIITDSPRHCSTQNYTVIPQHAIVNPELAEQYKCVLAYHANIPSVSHDGGGILSPQILKVRGTAPTTLLKTAGSLLFNGSIAISYSRQLPLEFSTPDIFTVLVKAKPYAVGGEQCFLGNLNSSAGVNNGWAVGYYGSHLGWACIQSDGSSNALQDTGVGFYTGEINNFGYVIDTSQTDLSMISPIVNGFLPGNLATGFSTAVLGSPNYGSSNTFSIGGLSGLGSKYLSGTYVYEIFIFKTKLDAQMFLAYESKPEDFWWWTGKNPLWTFKPPPTVTISRTVTSTNTIKKGVGKKEVFAPGKNITIQKRANKILSRTVGKSISLTISRYYRQTLSRTVSSTFAFSNRLVKLVNIIKTTSPVVSLKNRVNKILSKVETPLVTLNKQRRKILSFVSTVIPSKKIKLWLSPISATVGHTSTWKRQAQKRIILNPTTVLTRINKASHFLILLTQPTKTISLKNSIQKILGFTSIEIPSHIKQISKPITRTAPTTKTLNKSVSKTIPTIVSNIVPVLRKQAQKIFTKVQSSVMTIKKAITFSMALGGYYPVLTSFVYPNITTSSLRKRTLTTTSSVTETINTRRPIRITKVVTPTISQRISGWGKVLIKTVSPTTSIKKDVSKSMGLTTIGSTVTKSLRYIWGIAINVIRTPSVTRLNRNAYHLTLPFNLSPERLLRVRANVKRTIIASSSVTNFWNRIKLITISVVAGKTITIGKNIAKTITKQVSNTRTFTRTKITFVNIVILPLKTLSLKKGIRTTLTVQKSPTITRVKRVSKTIRFITSPILKFTKQWQVVFTKVSNMVTTVSSFLMPEFTKKLSKRLLGEKTNSNQRGREQ